MSGCRWLGLTGRLVGQNCTVNWPCCVPEFFVQECVRPHPETALFERSGVPARQLQVPLVLLA